ncbi:glycoside hydrolase family 3 C-terminal domain-containing protein [Streptomyces odontomachi]|uniref:glycoside hydrolase family 3 C-terminal domain-containing protein n=1 Tax=Streptomyces odontomachi TaxID=2944940 RepID=UPI00210ABA14|nr:glycoside hydrolase family 3 C-terminal domain-containing protein [Streptomyces sp. ODS25]
MAAEEAEPVQEAVAEEGAEAGVEQLAEKLDLAQQVKLLTGATTWRTAPEPAIGLTAIAFSDGPAGIRGEQWDERLTSVLLPSPTALAASWQPALVGELGALLAAEARRKGVHTVLAPTLNLHRSPLGGRHFECFSEDPWLTGVIGAALVRGVQGAGVAATAKHFVANDSEADRLTVDVHVSERVLREVYLAPFEAAVEAGVWLVMSAYNRVNGATMSASPLLRDPLKAEWGFDGVVVSDWGAVRDTVGPATAALDLAMPGPAGPWGDALAAAVREGRVPQSTVDEKVRRLLLLARRVGALGAAPGGSVAVDGGAAGGAGAAGAAGLAGAAGAAGLAGAAGAAGLAGAAGAAGLAGAAGAAGLAGAAEAAGAMGATEATGRAATTAPDPADASVTDTARVDTARADAAQTETAQADTTQPDTAQADTAQTDGTHPDAAQANTTHPDAAQADAAVRALLRRAASAGTVLLRNTGVLPLDPGGVRTLAVIGRHAAAPRAQGGGSAEVFPDRVVTPLDGIRAALPATTRVVHAPGPALDAPPLSERRGRCPHPAPLDGTLARDPLTGEPGIRLRVLDAADRAVFSEHRLSGRILEPHLAPGAHTVELSARCTPRQAGEWTFGVAGFGRMTLTVDGVPLVDGDFPRETDDPTQVHVRPPRQQARITLDAGRVVTVVARRELAADTGRATILSAAPPPSDDTADLAAAVDAARRADAAVLLVGTTEESESEGRDRTGLDLPGRQDELVRAVLAAQPHTAVCVNAGGPVAMPWHAGAPALLLTWFPGGEGGHALADVLFGRTEPGGRLPTTWGTTLADVPVHATDPSPEGVLAYTEGLHIGHRAWLRATTPPAYWFGHGLGYTTWAYEALHTPDEAVPDGAELRVRVRVRNTGPRAGREVVQVYLARPGSAVDRPVRWLAGFAEVTAAPGETVTAAVPVPHRALRHWSSDAHGWRVEPGPFTVLAGRSAGDIRLEGRLTVR